MARQPVRTRLPGGQTGGGWSLGAGAAILRIVSSSDASWELPGYELLERIALGGRGEIYLAREGGSGGELVVVKILRAEDAGRPDRVTAFIDEARLSSLLIHPNIVRVYHGDVHRGLPFLVMEHVDGITLWDLVERARMLNQQIPFGEAAYIAFQVAEALAYAHELVDSRGNPLDLVHRDVSAVNVMVTFDGVVKLLDFGIARSTLRSLSTAPGVIKGKLDYLSPEQCTGGDIDALTDIYSLGVLLFEMITGTRPYPEKKIEKLFIKVARGDRPKVRTLCPDVPHGLERIVDKAMATKRKARYGSARAMLEDLRAFMNRHSVLPTSSTLADLVVDLAHDRIEKVSGTYGPTHTTSVERIELPEDVGLFDPDEDLLDGPTIADPRLISELRDLDLPGEPEGMPYVTVVENPPSPPPVSRQAPIAGKPPLGPQNLFRRPILMLLTVIALFCLATLLGIVVTLVARDPAPAPQPLPENPPAEVDLVQPPATTPEVPAQPVTLPPAVESPQVETPQATPTKGSLHVTVQPLGARVELAGQSRIVSEGGVAFEATVGDHQMRVSATGYRSVVQRVTVSPDGPARVQVTLQPAATSKTGTLSVKTRRRATVRIDGVKIGYTPIEAFELDAGRHEVRVTNRYGARRRRVVITAGEEKALRFRNF